MERTIRNTAFVVLLICIASASTFFAPGQTGGQSQGNKSPQQKYAKFIFDDIKPVPPEMAAMMKQMQQ